MMKSFLFVSILLVGHLATGQVHVELTDSGAWFTEDDTPVLFYRSAPKSLNGRYERTNYIHPLFTLDGQVLTEDFPEDHPHQRGIFWAWHQLYIGDKRIGDGWEITDFSWDVVKMEEIKADGDSKAIQVEVLWKSPLWLTGDSTLKPFVRETTTIEVYPQRDNFRQIDVKISLQALEEAIRIGGSEDAKGYGGFSSRIRLADDVRFSGPDGQVEPDNLPVHAAGWMNIEQKLTGKEVGLTIISHPDNPGYPNPWILRAKNSMQNAVYPHPGAEAVPLSQLQLRYRLLVHEGQLEEITDIHEDFAGL